MNGLSRTSMVLILILCLAINRVHCQRNYNVVLKTCSASSMSPYTNITLVTRAVNNMSKVCDMYFEVYKTLDYVKVKIVTKAGNRTLISLSLDVCERFLRTQNSWWIKNYQQILKNGQMPEGCPIHRGSYFVKGYQIDVRFYPAYMPIVDMEVTTEVYTKENNQLMHMNHIVWAIKTVAKEPEKKKTKY